MEQLFDKVNNRDEGGTGKILDRKRGEDDDSDEEVVKDDEPQSEAAVRRSVLSVAAGDRVMEALERADQETKDIALFRRTHGADKNRPPNYLMLGMEPAPYILWVLRTIKSAELEQSLIVLSMRHIERLMYYLIVLLKGGRGVELCSRVAVFLVKAHQNQVRSKHFVASPIVLAVTIILLYLSDCQQRYVGAKHDVKISIPKFLSLLIARAVLNANN